MDHVLTASADAWNPTGIDNSTLPSAMLQNGKIVGNDIFVIPPGNYLVTGWKQSKASAILTFNGPTNLWIDGDVDIAGGQVVIAGTAASAVNIYVRNGHFDQGGNSAMSNPGEPGALRISLVSSGQYLSCSANLRAHLWVPLSDVIVNGNNNNGADFFGWILGKTLTFKGNVGLHYDESLPPGPGRTPALVK